METLPNDIYSLFDPDSTHVPNEENLEEFASNLKDLLRVRLSERDTSRGPLRFSALGKPDRQIWFDAHPNGTEEKMSGKTYFKFLYGDIIEQVLLFLAKEAGHSVEATQKQVEVDGVKGSIDAIIDGVVVDVKSASPHGYKKFKQGNLVNDDPFGYVAQLSGYSAELTPGKSAAWVAMDKVTADICVSPLSSSVIQDNLPAPRIKHLKEVIAQSEPPPLCYSPKPRGASGNMELPTGCSYCVHKFRCHPTVRTFLYSTGPAYLTKVVKEPEVPEITDYSNLGIEN